MTTNYQETGPGPQGPAATPPVSGAAPAPAPVPPSQPPERYYQTYYQGQTAWPHYNAGYPRPIERSLKRGTSRTAVVVSVIAILWVALIIGALAFTYYISPPGAWPFNVNGPVTTEQSALPLGSAATVGVDVNIGVGNLNISGGANDLLNATFQYSQPAMKPIVNYSENAGSGQLSIRQPDNNGPSFNYRYEWDLRLNNNVATNLKVTTGVADSQLRLAGMNLSGLEVRSGVGNTRLELTGLPARNLSVYIKGGVGNVTLVLPANVGVKVNASGGLSPVKAGSFIRSGNTYTNSAYGQTPTTIQIDLTQGVGDVTLESR